MKLKIILLLLIFSVNVFSQNKTSSNKKAESVENRKTGKKDTTQLSVEIRKREVLKKLYGDKPYGSLYVNSVRAPRQNYEAMGYGEVAKAENWNTLVPPRDMAERARKYEEKKQMELIGLVVLGGLLLFFGYKLITSNKKTIAVLPKDYNEKDYDVVKKKLNDMFSDDLLTKEELEAKLVHLEEKQMKEKKATELNLKKEKLYKAYQEGIITLEEYNAKLNSL